MRTVPDTESLRTEVAEATVALSVSFPCPQASTFFHLWIHTCLEMRFFLFMWLMEETNKDWAKR